MMRQDYKGKFLILKMSITIMMILCLALPYFTSMSYYISVLLLAVLLLTFFTLNGLLKKKESR